MLLGLLSELWVAIGESEMQVPLSEMPVLHELLRL